MLNFCCWLGPELKVFCNRKIGCCKVSINRLTYFEISRLALAGIGIFTNCNGFFELENGTKRILCFTFHNFFFGKRNDLVFGKRNYLVFQSNSNT